MQSCNSGQEVVFIYYSGSHEYCHAVVKNVSGPWSQNRAGFCGCEPDTGPIPWLSSPQGGLCHTCAKHVEQGADGKWYVKENIPDNLPYHRYTPSRHDCSCIDDD